MDESDQAAQYADERARMEQIDEILQAARKRPLHPDEIDVITWETGLGQFKKE